jgi:hypothetical protein
VYKSGCGEIGLNVNADKTSMVLFTKRGIWRAFSPQNGTDTEQSGKIFGLKPRAVY